MVKRASRCVLASSAQACGPRREVRGVNDGDVRREGDGLACGYGGGPEPADAVVGVADVQEHAMGRGAGVERSAGCNGERRDAGGGAVGSFGQRGGVGDLFGVDERDVRGDLPGRVGVPGAAQLFQGMASRGATNVVAW